jgi:hypothetical protein
MAPLRWHQACEMTDLLETPNKLINVKNKDIQEGGRGVGKADSGQNEG